MRFLTLIISLVAVLLISVGCNTNPPTKVIQEKGKIEITSDISGAKIFINNSDSGKLTPAVFELNPGKYSIKLLKEGYSSSEKKYNLIANQTVKASFILKKIKIQKIVLVEDFANVSCDPCVVSNKILHSLNTKLKGKIAIIKFPVNFPSPNDPFYNEAKKYADKRSSYYKIFSAPTVILDGTERPISTDESSINSKIEELLKKEVKFDVSVKKTINGNKIEIESEIKNLSATEINNLIVHTIVIEEKIEFQSPPGSNGEKVFYDVMRKMLPGVDGTALELTGNKQKIKVSADISSGWKKEELKIITFIQNKITKKVYQAALSE